MITGSSLQLTQSQADSVFNGVANQFASILNLIIDFRYVFIMLLFFIIIVRFIRKRRENYSGGQDVVSESRAVSGTGKKYGSIGGKAKNKGSIRNRFGFK